MQEIEKLSSKTDFSNISKAFTELNQELEKAGKNAIELDLSEESLKSEAGIKKLKAALDALDEEDLEQLKTVLKQIAVLI